MNAEAPSIPETSPDFPKIEVELADHMRGYVDVPVTLRTGEAFTVRIHAVDALTSYELARRFHGSPERLFIELLRASLLPAKDFDPAAFLRKLSIKHVARLSDVAAALALDANSDSGQKKTQEIGNSQTG